MTEPNANEPEAATPASKAESTKIADEPVTSASTSATSARVNGEVSDDEDDEDAAELPHLTARPEDAEAVDAADDEDTGRVAAEPDDVVVPVGNPLRWARGGVITAIGLLGILLVMAHDAQLPFGVPLGLLLTLVTSFGIADLLGTFDDGLVDRSGVRPEDAAREREETVTHRLRSSMDLAVLGSPLAQTTIAFAVFCGTLAGGQSGLLSQWLWGFLVTASFLLFVAALFRLGVILGPWAKDEMGLDRPLHKRHGFWVIVIGALLYLPMMGNYSLWDPWETHYGEVAREILSRDDWISLWWAQDGWFFSKPVLNFWIQALAMASLRTHYQPDQMLVGVGGYTAHPEWVVRTPIVMMTLVAMYFLYKGVAKVFGRRAGLIGTAILATMPDWYFLAHQTMTDMPCVAAMCAAMGLFMLGLYTDDEEKVPLYEVKAAGRAWRLSSWHLVIGAILVCAIPQVVYLFTRNLELTLHGNGPHGFRFHFDEFKSGSAGNCGIPGNEACLSQVPASIPKGLTHPDTMGEYFGRFFGAFEPALQGLLWTVLLGILLYINWGERRVRRLCYLAAWLFVAVSFMGKGPLGGLPVICAFAYIGVKKKWIELTRVELMSGLLIVAAVGLPWWVAMYVRHGAPFTDRLIFHDMFNRAFHHVHDTNEGDDTSIRFYIWQLGYALFPWTALAPLGLVYWARRGDSADQGRADASIFLLMWFLITFALVSFMGTKFHHYIFPAVAPVALLIGIVLDDVLGPKKLLRPGSIVPYSLGLGAGALLFVAGIARTLPGSIFGTKGPHGEMAEASKPLGLLLAIAGVALVVVTVRRYRGRREAARETGAGGPGVGALDALPLEDRRLVHERLMIGGASVAGGLALILVGRDLVIQPVGADQPGAIRLLQLFTYNYRRAWPDSLDFSGVLTAFTAAAVLLSFALAVIAVRRHIVAAFLALAFVWGIWGVDVYMVKTAPHWGQHEVIEAYYRDRKGPEEKLIAYQMNWKGENFYTGNRVPAFVSSGAPFTNYIRTEKEHGAKVMYFITEHSRVGGLKSEVGAKSYKEITDKTLDNKFIVIRAEL
jgi:4-amino-4-deoxy-L-arabinose transferase-like glycosyltransferase